MRREGYGPLLGCGSAADRRGNPSDAKGSRPAVDERIQREREIARARIESMQMQDAETRHTLADTKRYYDFTTM